MDEEWSRELDARIDDAGGGVSAEVTLYGSRDSFAPFYHGRRHDRPIVLDSCPRTSTQTMVQSRSTSIGS
jgi:hypothetical protein